MSRCSTTSTSRTLAENSAIRLDQRASGATIIVARSFMAFLARPAETIRSYQASRGLTSARPSGADGIARGRPLHCCSNDAEKFGSQVLSACIPGRSARWGAQSRGLPRDGAGQGPGLPPLKRRHPGMHPLLRRRGMGGRRSRRARLRLGRLHHSPAGEQHAGDHQVAERDRRRDAEPLPMPTASPCMKPKKVSTAPASAKAAALTNFAVDDEHARSRRAPGRRGSRRRRARSRPW